MKYDLDEIFNSIKQKYWWILCILCIPSAFYSSMNAEQLNQVYMSMFNGGAVTPTSMQGSFGLLLLTWLCLFLLYGYLTNYIKNYSEDIYYEEKEPNFVLYLITGLKLIPVSIFGYIMLILLMLIPGIVLGIVGGVLAKLFLPLSIILMILLVPISIFVVYGYMICSFLLFAKTNKITSVFRLPTIFSMLFNNKLAVIKCFLWILVICFPIFIIQISLFIISSIAAIYLTIWIFISYCYAMFSANIMAQLLRHISQNMGDRLY